MNDTLLIIFKKDGYAIICEDGSNMMFVDRTETQGIKSLKEAISVCVSHGYKFEVV